MGELTPEQLRAHADLVRGQTGICIRRASTYTVEPINWLWPGWLARGKLHIVAGAPGTGKTSVAMAFAAAITGGGRWPDGDTAGLGDVMIWSGEDDTSDTLIPRLVAVGADLERVHIIHGTRDEGEERTRTFDPASDMPRLSDEIAIMYPVPALLIIDSLVSAVAGDSHKNAEVRRSLQPLVDLAMTRRIAVLGISHFSKGTAGQDPVERVTGSLAFGALARVVMVAAKRNKEEGGGRILARGKSNIGRDDGGFAYDLEVLEVLPGIETTRVLWGDPLAGSARDLLSQAEASEDPEEKAAWQEARDWLEETLRDGPRKASEVLKEARTAGLTEKSLRTARERLRIRPTKEKHTLAGAWLWKLPGSAKMPSDSEDAQDALKSCSGGGQLPGQHGQKMANMPDEDARSCPLSEQKNGAPWAPSGDKGIFADDDNEAVF